MKVKRYANEDHLVAEAVKILVEKLGAVEAGRFLSLPREKRMESVQRHRQWQSTLDKDTFFADLFKS